MAVNNLYKILAVLVTVVMFTSCEEEYTPQPSGEGPKYVVEGYVETGQNAAPPYLILTRTLEFYGEIGPDQFNESYVHDANVEITDGSATVTFQEVCFDDLDEETKKLVAELFGFNADSLEINFCMYLDLLNELQAKEGSTYDLEITVDGDTITSTTYIPVHVSLDSMKFVPPPGEPNDTLAALSCFLSDPPNELNYYRFLVGTNDQPVEAGVSSIAEDVFFDGKSFEFQLLNPETSNGDVDPAVFGLYFVGDTVTVKWASVDEATFNFWNTSEFAKANQGPFSSYTRIESNIEGGIGVWGGYSISYYTKIVEY